MWEWISIGITVITLIGGFGLYSRKKLEELGKVKKERDQYKASYENEKRKNKLSNQADPTLDELLAWADRMSDDGSST